jgi:hypothetical protein
MRRNRGALMVGVFALAGVALFVSKLYAYQWKCNTPDPGCPNITCTSYQAQQTCQDGTPIDAISQSGFTRTPCDNGTGALCANTRQLVPYCIAMGYKSTPNNQCGTQVCFSLNSQPGCP